MTIADPLGTFTTEVLLAIATVSFAIGTIASLYSTWTDSEIAHRSGSVISLLIVFLLSIACIGVSAFDVVDTSVPIGIALLGAAAVIGAGLIANHLRQGSSRWRLVSSLSLFTGALALLLFSLLG